jgi:hypothetical protein
VWLAVLVASCEFTLRGPLRASSAYVNDFAAPYVSARLWLQHRDPYDPAAFLPEWHRAGAPTGPVYANPSSVHSVYPPPSIVTLLPLSLLPWPVASKLLVNLSALLYLTAIILLSSFTPGTWREPAKPIFLIYGLLFAPTQSALHVTNVACISASLLFLALYLLLRIHTRDNKLYSASLSSKASSSQYELSRERSLSESAPYPVLDLGTSIFAAVLLTLSLCIKPTLAPLVLIYLVWAHFWRILTTTLAAGTFICALSLNPLLKRNGDWLWLTNIQNNIHFVFFSGTADLALRNRSRFDRIDLQLPAYLITGSRTAALAIALVISIILIVLWLSSGHRSVSTAVNDRHLSDRSQSIGHFDARLDEHLLRISALLTIGLLPTYQRFYSAILVLIPILWTLRNLNSPRARWLLAFCSIFLVNASVLPKMLGLINDYSHPFKDTLLGAHVCWVLLLISSLLVWTLRSPVERYRWSRQPPKSTQTL